MVAFSFHFPQYGSCIYPHLSLDCAARLTGLLKSRENIPTVVLLSRKSTVISQNNVYGIIHHQKIYIVFCPIFEILDSS